MEQMDLLEGEKKKEIGLDVVESHNDNFVHRMRSVAIVISLSNGFVSADDLRKYDDPQIPHHKNAWGAIFRGKCWQCIGRRKSSYIDNHAREIRIWKYIG